MAPNHVQITDRDSPAEYRRAIDALRAVQRTHNVDLTALIEILHLFVRVSGNQVLRPRAPDYPNKVLLEDQITLAIELLDAKTLQWQVVAGVLPVIITLYELYSMRVDAISVYNAQFPTTPGVIYPPASINSNVPASELYAAEDRVRILRPIDAIVDGFYDALRGGVLDDAVRVYIVDFAYRIVSHYGPAQE
ncbi:unnamed protein product [Peniophora sp. CBMAI 1063]|nr:unnamed protein product [Peniophora sp. CBMAI 1063]